MRIAILSFDDPWSASHGGTQRTRLFLESVADLGHDAVCVYAGAETSSTITDSDGMLRVGVSTAPLGERPGLGLLGKLKRRYLPLPTIRGGYIPAVAQALDENGPYDVLITQQLRGVPYLPHTGGARLWLDQTDLWSRFLETEAETLPGLRKVTANAQRRHFRRQEIVAAGEAAVITAAGDGDRALLEAASKRPVSWLPTGVSQFESQIARDLDTGGPTAGLLGNFEYWPNLDAYDILVREWLPGLLASGWNVVVAGWSSDKLPRAEGITNLGPLESPASFYGVVDVSMAPIRLGAGVKVKVLESLFAGRPVFASPPALEGFRAGTVPGAVEVSLSRPTFLRPDELLTGAKLLDEDGAARFSRDGFRETVRATIEQLGR